MIFALVKDGVVVNVIVAEQDFADAIAPNYDAVVEVDYEDPKAPSIDWKYVEKEFSPPDPKEKTDEDIVDDKQQDIKFGTSLMAEISVYNDKRGLKDDQKLVFIKILSPFQGLLFTGDLKAFLSQILTVPKDKAIFTVEFCDFINAKIIKYLDTKNNVAMAAEVNLGK